MAHRQPPGAVITASGTNGTASWDGRTLTVRMRPWGTETAIPGRQIAEIKVSRPAFRMDVTTADGRRLMLRWWFGRGPQFTALRDAVMTSVAAMG